VADDIGVSNVTLREWYKRDQMKKKSKTRDKAPTAGTARVTKALLKDETPEERAARLERENVALRRENDSLRMDREILKKAAAFFAKENE
jgi:transposase